MGCCRRGSDDEGQRDAWGSNFGQKQYRRGRPDAASKDSKPKNGSEMAVVSVIIPNIPSSHHQKQHATHSLSHHHSRASRVNTTPSLRPLSTFAPPPSSSSTAAAVSEFLLLPPAPAQNSCVCRACPNQHLSMALLHESNRNPFGMLARVAILIN